MAQRFQPDIIGALSQGVGTVSLAASRLTIGGQQYKTGTINLVLSGLIANTMYNLYAVQSAGVVSLVASTNVNSVGPAGQTSWKLVGAFLTNYLAAFTQFLPIDGLVTLTCSVWSGVQVTINTNVVGFMDMTQGTDTYGLLRPNSGAYTSASGTFATANPRFINPLPLAHVRLRAEIGWTTTTANFANNWDCTFRKNGSNPTFITFETNGAGANQAGSLGFIKSRGSAQYDNCVAGDYVEIMALNNLANLATFCWHSQVDILATKQIKDM